MLRLDKAGKRFNRLESLRLADAGISERLDLQRMILSSADDFCHELGEDLLFVGEEIRPDDFVEDRIDILAIDRSGVAVIIELKRGNDKLQLLQALGYASMVSKWSVDRFLNGFCAGTMKSVEDINEKLEEFLDDPSSLNQSQRIILLAEDYDYEVLVTAEWLTEKYDLDIRCYRLVLSADAEENLLVTCTCIYPPAEITEHAKRRRGQASSGWTTWDDALKPVLNPAVANFFRKELAAKVEDDLRHALLRYYLDGKRRFLVYLQRRWAYVSQAGRFSDDEKFWTDLLGADAAVRIIQHGASLRFLLKTENAFKSFLDALSNKLSTVHFQEPDETVADGHQ